MFAGNLICGWAGSGAIAAVVIVGAAGVFRFFDKPIIVYAWKPVKTTKIPTIPIKRYSVFILVAYLWSK
ncbi:hypothetical protein HY490_05070 [Candidatus Woesearchaeota archaeon]|nr:hypothetical protein [Candidatus Woesearchaeota archaeon]